VTTTPPHLTVEVSGRGLGYLPQIPGEHGGRPDGYLEVHTSSSATGLYLWITSAANDQPEWQQMRHVSVVNAAMFADQIVEAIATHYGLADNALLGDLIGAIHEHMAELIAVLVEEASS